MSEQVLVICRELAAQIGNRPCLHDTSFAACWSSECANERSGGLASFQQLWHGVNGWTVNIPKGGQLRRVASAFPPLKGTAQTEFLEASEVVVLNPGVGRECAGGYSTSYTDPYAALRSSGGATTPQESELC